MSIFKEAAELKLQIKELEEKYEFLYPMLLHEAQKLLGEDTKQPIDVGELGFFTYSTRKKWKYSPDTTQLLETLKTRKQIEEQDGTATYTEKPQLAFRKFGEAE